MGDILMYFIMFVVPFFIIGGFIKLVKLNKSYQPAHDNEEESLFKDHNDFYYDPINRNFAGNIWNND
jgi:hypothetical protein